MRVMTALVTAMAFNVGMASGGLSFGRTDAQKSSGAIACEAHSTAQIRTTLYFGLARPNGTVTEQEWRQFLQDEVTKRFPEGLTVWGAEGQWRSSAGTINHEQTKVLVVIHPDTDSTRRSIRTVIESYRHTFQQQSVLWESARVCVAA